MRYSAIDPTFFIENRKRFVNHLKPQSIAVFHSNDEFPRNGDQNFPYRQNSDLFYLTGIEQEKTVLLFVPNHKNENLREILFILKPDESITIWQGHKLTEFEATAISGIKTIMFLEKFENLFFEILKITKNIYLNINENARFSSEVPYKDIRFAEEIKLKFPNLTIERCSSIMQKLRVIKSPVEIGLMQKACRITSETFKEVVQMIQPGMMEYEIEAEITHGFFRRGANAHAFSPIVASGVNATSLHYISNDKPCKNGELVLIDFGAEYANYPADMSRTVPVNGKFNKRQKECYNAVLRVMKQTKKMMVVGNTIENYHNEVCKLIEEEMIKLGLFTSEDVKIQDPQMPLFKNYFMHGVSHFIGLDVHDLGSKTEALREGMVLSCEPGIYIREEGIGIRIEDDILITEKGPINLFGNAFLEIEEIEEQMNKSKK